MDGKRNELRENIPEKPQVLNLVDTDFQATLLTMLRVVEATMEKELKVTRMMMSE